MQAVMVMCAYLGSIVNFLPNPFVMLSGGGDASNLWMANEASIAGLRLKASKTSWDPSKPLEAPNNNSLTWCWWLLELLPIKRLTYKSATATTR